MVVRILTSRLAKRFNGHASIRSCLRGLSKVKHSSFLLCILTASTSFDTVLGIRSKYFVLGRLEDDRKDDGILVFVDRFSQSVHLVAAPESTTVEGYARVSIDTVF